ncbi:MAG: hypothetical protein CMJ32_08075 [Phycisphaerae bacterium]|nr:hypothetical protein [Phycisphaerae bacterium]
MPRRPRYTIKAMEELARQLSFASSQAHLRQMIAAEDLLSELEPARTYPIDYVIFRITGYRSDLESGDTLLLGEALARNLLVFIQQLSELVDLRPDSRPGGAWTMEQLADRLGVSSKSIQRYRGRGLVCHYIKFPDGRSLGCFEESLQGFSVDNMELLERASAFTRVGEEEQERIIAAAGSLPELETIGIHGASVELSSRFERSIETIRNILRRHDMQAASPLFPPQASDRERAGRLLDRCWSISRRLDRVAARLGEPVPILRRIQAVRQARVLRRIHLNWIDPPTLSMEDSEKVILSSPGIGDSEELPYSTTDMHLLLEQLKRESRASIPSEWDEDALLAGRNLLMRRASEAIGLLDPYDPSIRTLDRIQSDLRWAILVKKRLIQSLLPQALLRIEQVHGGSLEGLPEDPLSTIINRTVGMISSHVDGFDSRRVGSRFSLEASKQQTLLARSMDYALNRAFARDPLLLRSGLASARPAGSRFIVDDILGNVDHFQHMVLPPVPCLQCVDDLQSDHAMLLRRRYGLGGMRPRTAEELAREHARRLDSMLAELEQAHIALRRCHRDTTTSA